MYKNVPEGKQDVFSQKVKETHQSTDTVHNKIYKYPSTKQEYWDIINEYWVELLSIISRYAPKHVVLLDKNIDKEFLKFNKEPSAFTAVYVTFLKEHENTALLEYFHKSWASAPDDGRIHLIPGWNVLCDLCSESYLAYDQPED